MSSSKNHVNIEFSTSYISTCIPDLITVIAEAAYRYCISFYCLLNHVDELILPIYLHKHPISHTKRINGCAKQTFALTFFTCNLTLVLSVLINILDLFLSSFQIKTV